MVILLNHSLQKALKKIGPAEHYEYLVHDSEQERTYSNSDNIITKYGDIKWQIIYLLNQHYSKIISEPFDLYNWLNYNENDEVSYFLSEVGSNSLNYSQYKTPHKFHLWLGKNRFILAIEQKGRGFNAQKINELKLKENEGAAFEFFRNSKGKIFFDNSQEARIVFLEVKL